MHHVVRQLAPSTIRHLLPRTTKRVVVLGGGPTGLFCADRLRHHFEVTVVDVKEYFEFTPGILRAVVEPSHLSKITFNYNEVLEKNLGVEFINGEATAITATEDASGRPSASAGSVMVVSRSPNGGMEKRQRLYFDYCVVAVGVSNGLWKPRPPRTQTPASPSQEPSGIASSLGGLSSSLGGAAASPTGTSLGSGGSSPSGSGVGSSSSSSSTSSSGGSSSSHSIPSSYSIAPPVDERNVEARRATMRRIRERLHDSRRVVIVGAGLVGVELAGELCHFYPRLKVNLIDGATSVLPQLAESSRNYARAWLEQRGVKVTLGTPWKPDMPAEGDLVFWCVGTRSRTASLFADQTVLHPNGQVRVNRRMQVLGSVSDVSAGPFKPICQGNVFAVGDAASIEGVPMAQMIFHGEEMAAVAVANIESAEDVASPLQVGKGHREIEALPLVSCTSLGPRDGIFSTQTELVATGLLASLQKQMIEDTKMGALKGQIVPSLLWMPVH